MSGRRAAVAVCLTAAGALLAPASLRAQAVMGRVVDSVSRRPLAGVPVRLVRDSAAAPDSTLPAGRTASDGTFALLAPAPGRYRLRVRDDFEGPVLALASADTADEHLYVVPPTPARAEAGADEVRVYGEREVERGARLIPRTGAMIDLADMLRRRSGPLPSRLRADVELVVGPDGRAEPGSVQLRSTSDFEYGAAAVRQYETARYEPALVGGRPVRQRLRVSTEARLRTEVRSVRVTGGP